MNTILPWAFLMNLNMIIGHDITSAAFYNLLVRGRDSLLDRKRDFLRILANNKSYPSLKQDVIKVYSMHFLMENLLNKSPFVCLSLRLSTNSYLSLEFKISSLIG